jgi:RNA polymerase sigma factor (TIGR02999 family)
VQWPTISLEEPQAPLLPDGSSHAPNPGRSCRIHRANKRGGGEWKKVPLDAAFVVPTERSPEFLALDEALQRLSRLNARQAQVVDLRYFVGLTVDETAAVLDLSPETVKLDWRFAKAWLHHEIEKSV